MKTTWIGIGAVVLIIGLALVGYGLSTPSKTTSTTTSTNTAPAVRNTNRVVSANGFWILGAANIVPGETVSGTATVSNYSSSDGPIFLYVQNESSYIAWGGCAPCGSSNVINKSLSSSGSYTFTWTAQKGGSYYFVLDVSYYKAAAPASFSANGVSVTTATVSQTSPNTTLEYAGLGVAVLGAILLGVGLVMGTSETKKPAG